MILKQFRPVGIFSGEDKMSARQNMVINISDRLVEECESSQALPLSIVGKAKFEATSQLVERRHGNRH
jgi:hypothetical protein